MCMIKKKSKVELIKTHRTSSGLLVSFPEGKMDGVTVITSSCTKNETCKLLSNNPVLVCHECYSFAGLSFKANARAAYELNTDILKNELSDLDKEEIAYILNTYLEDNNIFRLESHGDLNNETQLLNYFDIVSMIPHINCALWTKRLDILKKVRLSGVKKPANLNIVFSSPILNKCIVPTEVWVDGIFTVYTFIYAATHNIKINCGSLVCAMCQNCYKKHDGLFFINEILKSDNKRWYSWLNAGKPAIKPTKKDVVSMLGLRDTETTIKHYWNNKEYTLYIDRYMNKWLFDKKNNVTLINDTTNNYHSLSYEYVLTRYTQDKLTKSNIAFLKL